MAGSLEVVFRGDIAPGENLMEVRERLRVLFKADDEQLGRLFSGRPVVVRKGLDEAAAIRYQQAMGKAGAVVEVRSMAEPAEPVTEQTPSSPEPVSISSVSSGADKQWGVAPVGSDVLNADERNPDVATEVDISHISLTPEGTEVLREDERKAYEDRDVDTSHLSLNDPA